MSEEREDYSIPAEDGQFDGPSTMYAFDDEGNPRSESSPPLDSAENPVPQLDRRSKSHRLWPLQPRPPQPRPVQPRDSPPSSSYLRSYFDNPGRGVEVNLFRTQSPPPADDRRSASPDDQTSNPRTPLAPQTPTLEPTTDVSESGPAQAPALEQEKGPAPQSYFGKLSDYEPDELSAWTSGELTLRASPPRRTCVNNPPCTADIPALLCSACRVNRCEQKIALLDAEYKKNIDKRAANMVDPRYSTPERWSHRKAHDQLIVTRDAHLEQVKRSHKIDVLDDDVSVENALEGDSSEETISEDDMSEDDIQEDEVSEDDIQEDEVSEDDISEDNISEDEMSEDDSSEDSSAVEE